MSEKTVILQVRLKGIPDGVTTTDLNQRVHEILHRQQTDPIHDDAFLADCIETDCEQLLGLPESSISSVGITVSD